MKDNDLKWFATADLTKHKGEYVIILNKKIVMHGKNLKNMLNKFRNKYPEKIPKVAKIPEENLLVLKW